MSSMNDLQAPCGLLHLLCRKLWSLRAICRYHVGCFILYVDFFIRCCCSLCADVQALCRLLHPLRVMHRRYVGCYDLCVGCHVCRVGCCVLHARCTGVVWDVASSMWALTSYTHDVQVLCGLSHPLTLTLTITKA